MYEDCDSLEDLDGETRDVVAADAWSVGAILFNAATGIHHLTELHQCYQAEPLCHLNLCHLNLCHLNLCHLNLCHLKLCHLNLCHLNLDLQGCGRHCTGPPARLFTSLGLLAPKASLKPNFVTSARKADMGRRLAGGTVTG